MQVRTPVISPAGARALLTAFGPITRPGVQVLHTALLSAMPADSVTPTALALLAAIATICECNFANSQRIAVSHDPLTITPVPESGGPEPVSASDRLGRTPSQGSYLSMFTPSQWRAFGAAGLVATTLVGCGFHGTYPDTTEPDAAKLRLISNISNTLLDVFDTEHCEGRSLGMLNNMLAPNSRRRADMRVPAPDDAKAYVEVRLQPGHEVLTRANAVGAASACTINFTFTPQSGAEYEANFQTSQRGCRLELSRLSTVEGRVLRTPLVVANKGLPSCAGSNPYFKATAPQAPAQSAERSALIAQIIDTSLTAQMKPDASDALTGHQAVAKRSVEERKQRIGFALPEHYWAEYLRNLEAFANDTIAIKPRLLKQYTEHYRNQLALFDTPALEQLVPDSPTANRSSIASNNSAMLEFYHQQRDALVRDTMSAHQARMADLDRRFNVCERFAGCWRN